MFLCSGAPAEPPNPRRRVFCGGTREARGPYATAPTSTPPGPATAAYPRSLPASIPHPSSPHPLRSPRTLTTPPPPYHHHPRHRTGASTPPHHTHSGPPHHFTLPPPTRSTRTAPRQDQSLSHALDMSTFGARGPRRSLLSCCLAIRVAAGDTARRLACEEVAIDDEGDGRCRIFSPSPTAATRAISTGLECQYRSRAARLPSSLQRTELAGWCRVGAGDWYRLGAGGWLLPARCVAAAAALAATLRLRYQYRTVAKASAPSLSNHTAARTTIIAHEFGKTCRAAASTRPAAAPLRWPHNEILPQNIKNESITWRAKTNANGCRIHGTCPSETGGEAYTETYMSRLSCVEAMRLIVSSPLVTCKSVIRP